MAIVLYPHELLAAVDRVGTVGPSDAEAFRARMETLCNEMAARIAEGTGAVALPAVINFDPEGTNQGVAFEPAFAGQPCPEVFESFDNAEEWGDEADETPAADPVSARIAELEAERDSYVLGSPSGHEEPNPDGWALDNPDDAEELARLYLSQMGRTNA